MSIKPLARIEATGVMGPVTGAPGVPALAQVQVHAPAPAPAPPPAGALDPEWPQLWFAALQREWSSLVVVPAAAGVPSLFAARAIAEAGRLYRGHAVHLLDATGAGPTAATAVVAAAAELSARGEQSVVAVDWPLANHPAIHVARSADAALLLVPLGTASLADTRRTVDAVGRDRFLGSVTVKPTARRARR